MMTTKIMPAVVNNDAELVSGTLAGNRDAFGQIVSRYQSLICSLAYSATGSLGQSEDLAQETFITAWKHLRHLRERDKLRSWLCGIARNRINNFLRREGREPVREAESLENIPESHSPEPLPPNKPSATRSRRFSGARSNASRKFTANRSFCFIANINPSKPSRKVWS